MAKKKGLWDNIHAKRKRGEAPAKKGSKDYPETLDIGEGLKKARKNVGADTCWDGYKAKGTKKKDGKEVPNCVKEGKSFGAFCSEAYDKPEERLKTDRYMYSIPKGEQDSAKERLLLKAQAKKKKVEEATSMTIEDAEGNLAAEITNLIEPEPMTGWRQQMATEGYKDLPKRKMGMKAGKKILSAVKDAATSGAAGEGTIEDQISMQKAEKKAKQADKIHSKAKSHSEPLSRMKSLKNKLKGKLKEDWSKKNKGDKVDGMGDASIKAYRRENPGSKLKGAVTGKPKKGSKDAARKSSYCDRSEGQKDMHNIDCSSTPDKPICKARKRWNC